MSNAGVPVLRSVKVAVQTRGPSSTSLRVTIFFFFQAEDGIRDYKVTGVQTCALPILAPPDRPSRIGGGGRAGPPSRPGRALAVGAGVRAGGGACGRSRRRSRRREIGRASCRGRV